MREIGNRSDFIHSQTLIIRYSALNLLSERQNGILENSRYRIGGQWNEEAGRWLWVNGDPVFGASGINQTDCYIDSNDGDLMWDEKENLRNTNSGNGEKFICEKVL